MHRAVFYKRGIYRELDLQDVDLVPIFRKFFHRPQDDLRLPLRILEPFYVEAIDVIPDRLQKNGISSASHSAPIRSIIASL